ncbi:LPS-assembly protein LptD [Halomonas lysinitropha]|uniref:LPS-assembly protein LptD n=1 Tax=Halomonas lysinitropha TaxID=2607506 RepID=A0A5K1I265_9GAMM|nr:LPS-assembly protein LptD [Halomonas lysinitropha]VVZ95446.1 LPS-assembly protein LptD precursor [Halomonas lysinitropha]
MGKRLSWTWTALAGLACTGLASGPLAAAPPEPLPADKLDWQPWGDARPAGELCRGRYVMPDYRLPPPPGQKVASESDLADYGKDGETTLGGEVLLRRGDAQLEAPRVRVPGSRETAYAEGPLALRDSGLLVRGDAAELSLTSDAASIDMAHYVAHEQRLRGDAVRLARLEDGRYRLTEASFTTCEPGSDVWRLVGSDILLDRERGVGTATHARLEMGKVPVLYWPWVRFPLDERRQTGFLWPTIGLSSDSLDYAQPFYWNIAANHDATLTPRWISDRGLLLGGEYRYLFEQDAGQIEGAYIVDDQAAGEEASSTSTLESGDARWYLDYRHAGRFDARTRYRLRYGAASDGRYFDDFGRGFGEDSTASMPRLAQLDHRGDVWQLQARAQGYQKLDDPLLERDKPFYRLPSLAANARWSQDSGFYQQWRSNLTHFWRDVDETRVPLREAANGARLHLSPAAGWRFDESWGHLEPRVEWLATAYQLDYGERETERDESLTRSVPVGTLDGGLVFERELDLGGRGYRQTLEPRINYAFVPARDQSDFPDFDTSEQAFSWNQLWSPYRFSGSDRVGDLNRVSLGLESRLLADATGRERLSFGVGQAYYLEDRTIDMEGDPDKSERDDYANFNSYYRATRDRSPLVTRVDWQLTDHWRSRWQWLYDDHLEQTESTSLAVQYRADAGHVLNFGYRWQLEGFDPAQEDEDVVNYNLGEYDLSFAWKASRRLDLIGRLLYDNTNDRALEQLAGVQWNDCCYGLQLVWREWIDDNDTANTIEDDLTDRGVFLRFVFKGLGGVGGEADSYFEEAIPGYRATALGRF